MLIKKVGNSLNVFNFFRIKLYIEDFKLLSIRFKTHYE
jgi:hypothetical protein